MIESYKPLQPGRLRIAHRQLDLADNLPEPAVIARDIIADLESALEQLRLIAEDVGDEAGEIV